MESIGHHLRGYVLDLKLVEYCKSLPEQCDIGTCLRTNICRDVSLIVVTYRELCLFVFTPCIYHVVIVAYLLCR